MNRIIEAVAMTVGGLSVFLVCFVGFVALSGKDMSKVAVIGKLFPAPEKPPGDELVAVPPDESERQRNLSDSAVIEVADSTRDFDRGEKLPRYAAAGIAEAWLADLGSGMLERHSEPRDGLYRQVSIGRPGERLTSTVLPDLAIPVSLALGQPGD